MYCGKLAAFLQRKFLDGVFWLNHPRHGWISFLAPDSYALQLNARSATRRAVATGLMETGRR